MADRDEEGKTEIQKVKCQKQKKCTIKMPALHCFDVFLVNFELCFFLF